MEAWSVLEGQRVWSEAFMAARASNYNALQQLIPALCLSATTVSAGAASAVALPMVCRKRPLLLNFFL